MFWMLLGLFLACALCSWVRPDSALARSAALAFDTSVWMFSQGVEDDVEVEDDDDVPQSLRYAQHRLYDRRIDTPHVFLALYLLFCASNSCYQS